MNHKITTPYHLELLKKLKEHAGEGTDKRKGQAEKDYAGTTKIYHDIKASVKENFQMGENFAKIETYGYYQNYQPSSQGIY